MKWRRVILLLFFIFGVFTAPAQKLECERMFFDMANYASDDEPGVKVTATIKVKHLKNDTLVLRTSVRQTIWSLGPQNLKAGIAGKNGTLMPLTSWIETQTPPSHSSDAQLLKVLMPNMRKGRVQMSYTVIGTDIFEYMGGSNESFGSIHSDKECVYPTNVPIRDVHVSSPPDSLAFFFSYTKGKSGIRDINLSIVVKADYDKKTITKGNGNVNIYVPDTLRNDTKMQRNIDSLARHIDRLSLHLPLPTNTDIIYINWRDDKARVAAGKGLGNHVVCDINFGDKSLLHELLHCCLPVDVESPSKGEYVVKESITEWLTRFFSDSPIDASFVGHSDSISPYDVRINNHAAWEAVYTTGPAIIERIASRYGRTKMADLIVSFVQKNRDRTVTYDRFAKYLSRHLPRDLMDEFTDLMTGRSEE